MKLINWHYSNMKLLVLLLTNDDSDKMKSYVNKCPSYMFKIFDEPLINYTKDIYKDIATKIVVINENDYSSVKNDIKEYDNVLISYANMPLLLKESVKKILNIHIKNNNDVTHSDNLFIINAITFLTFVSKNCIINISKILKECEHQEFIKLNSRETKIIDTRFKLQEATKIIQKRINKKHLDNGVSIVDVATTYIGKDVLIGNDTTIYPNTYILGKSIIGVDCEIGPNAYIYNGFIDNKEKLINVSYIQKNSK